MTPIQEAIAYFKGIKKEMPDQKENFDINSALAALRTMSSLINKSDRCNCEDRVILKFKAFGGKL